MTILDKYAELTSAEFRAVVADTAQVLLEFNADSSSFPHDFLQRSSTSMAREIEPLLHEVEPSITFRDVQRALEDEEMAVQLCSGVLEKVRAIPEVAELVARRYEARRRNMAGVEMVLLAGALVVLALRIKRVHWSSRERYIEFEAAGEAVKTFVAALVKSIGPHPS